jgi:ankyrin repeat protein
LDELNRLYEAELRVDGEDDDGDEEALERRRVRVARELLNERDRQGSNAFLLAASYGQLEVARWLCEKFYRAIESNAANWNCPTNNTTASGADNPNSANHQQFYLSLDQPRNDGQTACMQAAAHGHTPFLTFLISDECGFPLTALNACDVSGDSVMMVSAGNGHIETCEWLHVRGTNMMHTSKSRSNCLHRAAVGGHVPMLQWLLERGMDVNAVTEKGLTALHYAVKNDRIDAAAFLLSQGAHVHVGEVSPIDIARQGGKATMMLLFASHGLI